MVVAHILETLLVTFPARVSIIARFPSGCKGNLMFSPNFGELGKRGWANLYNMSSVQGDIPASGLCRALIKTADRGRLERGRDAQDLALFEKCQNAVLGHLFSQELR